MSSKLRNRKVPPGIEIVNSDPDKQVGSSYDFKEIEASIDRQQLEERLAHSLELRIKTVTGASLGQWPAEIVKITFDTDGLLIATLVPFPLLRPSPVSGEWPPSRREQEHTREQYAEFLLTKESGMDLASFFYQKLVNFMIKRRCPEKLSPDVLKRLRGIVQRDLAGRPAGVMSPKMRVRIATEGRSILRAMRAIKGQVELWQKKNKRLKDSTILRRLRKEYLTSSFPWIEHFWKMSEGLPRRRYWTARIDELAYSEEASPDADMPPAKISEPKDWSTIDIAAKVTQAHLLKETGKRIALLKIKAHIR